MHKMWLTTRISLWLLVCIGVWCEPDMVLAQVESATTMQENALAALPPDVLTKIRQLAELLQQSILNGQLNDARIHQELHGGDLEATIRGLGPEAGRLFDDIRTGLRASRNEESLTAILQGLVPPSP